MADLPQQPILREPIPSKIVNEGASFGPFDLKKYINSPPESGKLRFAGELETGESFPEGLICTEDGLISGIPGKDTQGVYHMVISVENDSGIPLEVKFTLTIKASLMAEEGDKNLEWFNDLKSRVWEALGKDLPLPDMSELHSRPITAAEIYYLLERYATLTIWDAYNLEMPSEKILLNLEGLSPHYIAYDRGSCLVVTPKDLYSYERTLEDALQSARVIAREVYSRGWTIQFAGFEKMARAAWVELQYLGDAHGKQLEILHYNPSPEDMKIYASKSGTARLTR